jgi:hypothetical protein
MRELHLSLDFECSACNEPVGVTVRCTGKGILGGFRGAARVNVPCPTCGEVSEVIFEPSGVVRDVQPYERRRAPAPSAN